ncbi:MAG: RIP metalloprotease RseP [Calditrichia bacterium]
MIYLISIIFVLSILIFFHELGHFLLAKLFGVRVERFSIGFPPRLFGFKWGETDYCISAIPFGGYVKMAGVIDESMDTSTLTGAPYEFASKKWWQKVAILGGGVTMNLILAWIILSALLHFQGEPILPGTVIGQVQTGGVAEKAGLQAYDKILSVNGQAVQNWNDIRDALVANINKGLTFKVERAGEVLNITISKDEMKQLENDQLDFSPLLLPKVGEIISGSAAEKSGLQPGDLILSINGQPTRSWDEMTDVIRRNPDKPLDLLVERNGRQLQLTVTPQPMDEIDENGVSHIVGKIGVGIYYEKRTVGLGTAITEGLEKTGFYTALNVKALSWLITGQRSAREMLGGPIMITKMAGDFAKSGFGSLMELIAHLSIMLAIVNILPIPALDGGHITIVLIEQIRRKPLSTKTKLRIQQWGMGILFVLMFFVIYNDILRLM